jgi:hypothetical protein
MIIIIAVVPVAAVANMIMIVIAPYWSEITVLNMK